MNIPEPTPLYLPPSLPPSYSNDVRRGERLLTYTLVSGEYHEVPRGLLRRHGDSLSLSLKEQFPDSVRPTYGRGQSVRGDIRVTNAVGVVSVEVIVRPVYFIVIHVNLTSIN
jgi:hypothetical protein